MEPNREAEEGGKCGGGIVRISILFALMASYNGRL